MPSKSATKTAAGVRKIPIPDAAREYIDFDNLNDGFLFQNIDGKPLTFTMHRKLWNSFITQALGADTQITVHYLRHNYVTMLCENNIPLIAAKAYVGDKDDDVINKIYSHFSEKLQIQSNQSMKKLNTNNP